jgi:phosphoribosylanthranilate isomerase
MFKTKVKICGITNYNDAKICIDAGADALGFVFYKNSKRYITPIKAKEIIKKIPPFISKVGVFVNENFENIIEIANLIKIDYIQLHGYETPEFCKKISNYYPVIKAILIKDENDLKQFKIYKKYVNFLLDTKTESFGGSGKSFNWNLILNYKEKIGNFILSGGLNKDNIVDAIKLLNPYAVDISSGVEKSAGKKDKRKVEEFISIVKSL